MPAAISVGTNPQFDGTERTVEAYAIDRVGLDLYGLHVAVDFLAYLRGRRSSTRIDALLERMADDVKRARELIEARRLSRRLAARRRHAPTYRCRGPAASPAVRLLGGCGGLPLPGRRRLLPLRAAGSRTSGLRPGCHSCGGGCCAGPALLRRGRTRAGGWPGPAAATAGRALRLAGLLRVAALLPRVALLRLARLAAAGPARRRRPSAAALPLRRPQPLRLLGAGEVLGDHRGELEVRLPDLRPHHVEVDLGARRQVLVERHDHDAAAAGLEVRDDVLDLDHLAGLADPGDHRDAALRPGRRSRARTASPAWCSRCSRRPRDGVETMISWSARSSTPRIAL